MDRVNELRSGCGSSGSSPLSTSRDSVGYHTATSDSSKYFSLSEADSTLNITADEDHITPPDNSLVSQLSPIKSNELLEDFKIGKTIEAAKILSGGVDIFEDNENSYDEHQLIIDVSAEGKLGQDFCRSDDVKDESVCDVGVSESDAVTPSKDTCKEVLLPINGKLVPALDIGNALFLYRRKSQGDELAAVQAVPEGPQPNYNFLKVRENDEGNLEVYEEIKIEVDVTNDVPSNVPTSQLIETKSNSDTLKTADMVSPAPQNDIVAPVETKETKEDPKRDEIPAQCDAKPMEPKKPPIIGNITPVAYHTTSNKDGIPLTKTMVDLKLHPSRHSDNIKKTIELNTEVCKQKVVEYPEKCKVDDKDNVKDIKSEDLEVIEQEPKNDSASNINELTQKSADVISNEEKNVIVEHDESSDCKNKMSRHEPGNEVMVKVCEPEGVLKEAKENSCPNDMGSTQIAPDINEVREQSGNKTEKSLDNEKTHDSKITPDIKELREQSEDKTEKGLDNEKTYDSQGTTTTQTVADVDKMKDKGESDKKCNSEQEPKEVEPKLPIQIDEVKEQEEDKGVLKIKEVNEIEKDMNSDIPKSTSVKLLEADIVLKQTTIEQTPLHDTIDSKPKSKELIDSVSIAEENNAIVDITKEKNESSLKDHYENDVSAKVEVPQVETPQVEAPQVETPQVETPQVDEVDCNIKLHKEEVTLSKEMTIIEEDAKSKHQSTLQAEPTLDRSADLEISKNAAVLAGSDMTNIPKPIEVKQCENIIPTVIENKQEIVNVNKNSNSMVPSTNINVPVKPSASHAANVDLKTKSEDLLQPSDLGIPTNKGKPKELMEKGFPDFKSVVDILKPKAYDNKKVSSYCYPSSVKNDQTIQSKPQIFGKTDFSSTKITKPIAIKPSPVTIIESVSYSVEKSKPKTFMDFSKISEEHNAHINKHVNKLQSCLIKSNAMGDNVQSLFKKSETIVRDAQASSTSETVPKIINNNNAVPFGKWTEANKQAYLNKIKEPKVVSNPNQIKQAKDLNRRDILKKMDSQRQSLVNYSRSLEVLNRSNIKKELTVYPNKTGLNQDIKIAAKDEISKSRNDKQKIPVMVKSQDIELVHPKSDADIPKIEGQKRQDFNNQALIDRTIEDMINIKVGKPIDSIITQTINIEQVKNSDSVTVQPPRNDEIEKKMNELHGIPFVERPVHELPRYNRELTTYARAKKSTNKIPIKDSKAPAKKIIDMKPMKTIHLDDYSEDEVIEHEPVTGDIKLVKKNVMFGTTTQSPQLTQSSFDKKTGVTEKHSDKFSKQAPKTQGKNRLTHASDSKTYQLTASKDVANNKHNIQSNVHSKPNQPNTLPFKQSGLPIQSQTMTLTRGESGNKTSPTKVQMAYTSALSAKRQKESPIRVLEDRPVKVVFVDSGSSYVTSQLNVQGKELSPLKRPYESDKEVRSCDALDASTKAESMSGEPKRNTSKHQRKQVLTPVEEPDLQLVSPLVNDNITEKKKRKLDDNLTNNDKGVISKKTYLLNRSISSVEIPKDIPMNPVRKDIGPSSNAASAIDNLVKAAELIDSQARKKSMNDETAASPQLPVKRGRGRPRKNPIPVENTEKGQSPTVSRVSRIAKSKPPPSPSEHDDDDSSDDSEIIMENWTMGKINENIVCPICGKLFRSENVVFKHVKHCTGPSPNRSETSDRRASKRGRKRSAASDDSFLSSQPSDAKSKDRTTPLSKTIDYTESSKDDASKRGNNRDEQNLEKEPESGKIMNKQSVQTKYGNFVCGICEKSFRQMSYYRKHEEECKANQKSAAQKNKESASNLSSVFSCEVCKKDFRKLHHLVQHRIIHNPTISRRRKSSVEQSDKGLKKSAEEQSAGFRCEACDKSFRKLHHLVEHRETHDVATRLKAVAAPQPSLDKAEALPPQCDVCKKTFRKLHHMIEHKEQHTETNTAKSEEKQTKGSLTTKDIIHECPLCYMVFPNEHSLNKHSVFCQKKKRQSVSKQAAPTEEAEDETDDAEPADVVPKTIEPSVVPDAPKTVTEVEKFEPIEIKNPEVTAAPKKRPSTEISKPDASISNEVVKSNTINISDSVELEATPKCKVKEKTEIKDITKVTPKTKMPEIIDTIVIEDTPVKRRSTEASLPTNVTKRQKIEVVAEEKVISDDDEVRYMLNPDFKATEGDSELFMKKASLKRNSLQIDRPSSKHAETLKRRTSLQHITKLNLKPKLNAKSKLAKDKPAKVEEKEVPKSNISDSDDSDTKYAFPEKEAVSKEPKKVQKRKSLNEKRKSLTGIAKRKTLGDTNVKKAVVSQPVPKPPIKRRTLHNTEHRCDCGQLFYSATLLSHHVTVTHTPPRRRRLSPAPSLPPPQRKQTKPETKTTKKEVTKKPLPSKAVEPKAIVKTVARKSSVRNEKDLSTSSTEKRAKRTTVAASTSISNTKSTAKKRRKVGFHSGVPMPEKMKKLFNKQNK